jgi:hypothetical protein
MARGFLCTALVFILIGTIATAQDEWYKPCDGSSTWDEVKELSHEVSMLNLVNGLHLTDKQIEKIIELATKAGELQKRTCTERAQEAEEFSDTLKDLKEILIRDEKKIPKSCEERVHQVEHDMKISEAEYNKKLKALEKELIAILSDAQVEVIRTFQPCTIPPKELGDPVRAGQAAGEHAEIEMQIEHLRNLPKKAYKVFVDPLINALLKEWNHILKYSPEELKAEAKRLRGVVDEARSLSDAEFALRSPELAAQVVKGILDFQKKSVEIVDFFSKFSPLSQPGNWLLNPKIVPLLQAKLEARKENGESIEEIAPVERCTDPNKCGTYGKSDKMAGVCLCGKPTFAGLCNRFAIPEEKREGLRETMAKGQIEMLNLLCEPMEDGTIPLSKVFSNPECFGEVLMELSPDGDMTYAERIEQVKQRIHRAIRRCVDRPTYRKFLGSGIDVFDVHVGNLNKFE